MLMSSSLGKIQLIKCMKRTARGVFKGAGFEFQKWNSNVPELEADNQLTEVSQAYAKEQFGVKTNDAKLLGPPWDKVQDPLVLTFSCDSHGATKEFSFNV